MARASPATRKSQWALVLLAGACSFVLYALLLTVVARLSTREPSFAAEIFPWVEPMPVKDEDYDPSPSQSGLVYEAPAIWFVALVLGLYALYALVLHALAGHRSRALEAALFGLAAGFLLLQTTGAAMLSGDLFSYVLYGRIFALYDTSPYTQTPSAFAQDPYLPLVYWKDVPSFYGPLWTLISAGLSLLGGEHIGRAVLLFRLTAVFGALAAGALLWSCLRSIAPGRVCHGLVFFLWNPLVVLESGLSGHNDSVMVALLLLGVWLHLRSRCTLALIALTLSALVKYVTLLVVPLYVLMVLRRIPTWRQRARYILASGSSAGLVAVVVLLLARSGPEVVVVGSLGSGVERYANNVHEIIYGAIRLRLGEETASVSGPTLWDPRPPIEAQQANAWLRLFTWGTFLPFWILAAWRSDRLRAFLLWSLGVMLASYWLLGSWIWPWYVIWSLGLAALVPGSPIAGLAVLLSATVLSLYAANDYAGTPHGWWIFTYRALPAFVLPLVLFGLVSLARYLLRLRLESRARAAIRELAQHV